jgi:two-component system sensor histidine kinase ChvG
VFERFYTSRPKGTVFGANSGLGLSIVRQIVEAHGGRVQAGTASPPTGGRRRPLRGRPADNPSGRIRRG